MVTKAPPKLDFVLCIEQGYLEQQAKLLIHTLRNFGGEIGQSAIYAYQPRKRYKVSAETIKFLESHQVEFVDHVQNTQLRHFNFANKPIVCAHHEKSTSANSIVWLDCDTFFYNEPKLFSKALSNTILLRPEDAKGLASNPSLNDSQGAYWKKLYKQFNVEYDGSGFYTLMDNALVNPYFNAGLFKVIANAGFMERFKYNLQKAVKNGLYFKGQSVLLEQTIFSVTVTQMQLRIEQMPPEYNFPLNLWLFDGIDNPNYQKFDIKNLVCGHYHKIFLRGSNYLRPHFNKTDKGKQLLGKIEEFNLLTFLNPKFRYRVYRKIDDIIMRIQ